jgi:DNA replication and repair protein RecF
MLIQRLQVQNVRNLSRVNLDALKPINVFYGTNGSGKTSLLEAVHLLLMGRTFRHAQFKPLLSEGQDECVVFAELLAEDSRKMALGLSRRQEGKPTIKLDAGRLETLAELAQIAPIQVLNSDTFEMLTGGPSRRREYLDWGLFHVEPRFFPVWRLAQRALKQRNSLIRHGKIVRDQLELWSREYARYGEQLDLLREDYFAELLPRCRRILMDLSPVVAERIEVTYFRGWAKGRELEPLLLEGIDRDLQQGFTRTGPHRADLRVMAGNSAAAEILSRGQLKVAVAGFYLAQAELLRDRADKHSIFLIDDLAAELDDYHRRQLCAQLQRLELQVLATCIGRDELVDCWHKPEQLAMFHVEHGKIFPELASEHA